MNEDKFTYKEGEVQVTIPQCFNCKHRKNGQCTLGKDIEQAYKNDCQAYENN